MEKQKRIKRVFTSHDQVVHLWVNQSQSDARCKNVFFEGTKIYSYGSHYLLGDLIQHNGVTIAVINNRGYSVTTSKHIYSAIHAVKHMPYLTTKDWSSFSVKRAMLDEQDRLVDSLMKHFSTRRGYYSEKWNCKEEYGIEADVTRFNNLCDLLNFPKLKLDVNQSFIEIYNDHNKACMLKRKEKDAAGEAARDERRRLEAINGPLEVEAWRQGGPTTNAVRSANPQLLRVKGDTVETSRGAEVPLKHALRLLRMIESKTAKRGERVGGFSVDKVLKTCIAIGCHTIGLKEARAVLSNLSPKLSIVGGE